MTAKIIDGRRLAASMRIALGDRVQRLREGGVHPSLAVILIGDDPASKVYVRNKIKACDPESSRANRMADMTFSALASVSFSLC